MTSDEQNPKLNPWHPMSDPVDLKHLGKLLEELGELTAAVSRCLIQGIDEKEPVTGKVNREWLEDEISDVKANLWLVEVQFSLNTANILNRAQRKMENLKTWHDKA